MHPTNRHVTSGAKRRFVKSALNNYATVGAVTPSSNFVVKKVLRHIPRCSHLTIEYGSGDGVLTRPLLGHLDEHATLFAVEISDEFVGILKRIEDSRLRVIHRDVRNLPAFLEAEHFPGADCIVINIPLTFFSPKDRHRIIRDAYALLVPGGTIVIYQYSPLIFPVLKKLVGAKITTDFEVRNFPPYFIFAVQKTT